MIIVRRPAVAEAWQRFRDATADAPPTRYGGLSREETVAALRRAKAPEEVAALLGNPDWAALVCDECGEDKPAMIYFGAASMCRTCLDKAAALYDEATA